MLQLPAPARKLMAQSEEYEIWILENGKWGLKAWSRDFEVGWAVARTYTTPVRILRAVFNGTSVAERNLVAELQSSPKGDL
jgi:hypothetical protein